MFESDPGAGTAGWATYEPQFIAETLASIHRWRSRPPDAGALARNVGALDFAFTAAVINQDAELLQLPLKALDIIRDGANLETLSNELLAACIRLNLRAFAVTRDSQYEGGALKAVRAAQARWDEPNAFFKTDAADTANVFYTDANAPLGEAFYLAWRALDDATLRPPAGEVLGRVSDLFDATAGLYERQDLSDGAASEPDWLAAYSAAIQLFLTASETTGRGTYLARACIVADYALTHLDVTASVLRHQFDFGRALARLGLSNAAAQYREPANEILRRVTQTYAYPIVP